MVAAAKTGENTSANSAGANDDGDATRPVRVKGIRRPLAAYNVLATNREN